MYAVSLQEGRVRDVFDTELYVDEGVELFEITEEEKNRIWAHGDLGDFRYIDGKIVFDRHPDNIASDVRKEIKRRLEQEVDPIATNALRWADLSPEKQQEWSDYRRALLDITEQSGFPTDIVWPVKPE